jgi:hypothetical protein
MISFQIILLILLVHWLADFCLQTDGQALRKSTEVGPLAEHVTTYSMVWLLVAFTIFGDWEKSTIFAMITWIAHYCTDWVTSRIGKMYWDKKDLHNGFVVMGFDQILHYLQLFLCYIWLSKV